MLWGHWIASHARRISLMFAVIATAALLSGCTIHGKGDKSSHEATVLPAVTSNAINKLPENLNVVSVDVTNGAFGVSEIMLQQQGASTVNIVNHDASAYQFEITPNLVTATPVKANATTSVSFTSPNSGSFTGQLLPSGGGAAVATITVRIQSAGGVNP